MLWVVVGPMGEMGMEYFNSEGTYGLRPVIELSISASF
jgi:hypothetical protein